MFCPNSHTFVQGIEDGNIGETFHKLETFWSFVYFNWNIIINAFRMNFILHFTCENFIRYSNN